MMCLFDEIDNGPVIKREEISLSSQGRTNAQVILSQIILGTELNQKEDKGEWVALHSSIMQLFDRNYKIVILYLIQKGFIERDDYYVKNEKTYYYRVKKSFNGYKKVNGYPYIHMDGCDVNNFKLALERYNNAKISFMINKSNHKENALRTLNRANNNKLVNKVGVYSFDAPKNVILDEIRNKEVKPWQKAKTEESIKNAKRFIENVNSMKSGEIGYDKNMSRFFDMISSMPRDVRKHLRLNGHKLIEIDILSCQPQLSVNYFKEIGVIDTNYFHKVKSGRIYETIQEADPSLPREPYKTLFNKWVMGNKYNRTRVSQKHSEWMTTDLLRKVDNKFHQEFPIVARYLRNNRENIALELQYRESVVMNNVYDKLVENGLNLNVLFLHDCVYVIDNEYADKVIKIVEQELMDNDLIVRPYNKEMKEDKEVKEVNGIKGNERNGNYIGLGEDILSYVIHNIKSNNETIKKERVKDDYDDIFNRFLTETKEKELEFEF